MKWIKYEVDVAEHPWHCSNCGWSWDGWDYWYTWGASKDDDFYCKHGIRGGMEEEDANI